jgi:hypothetical protein
MSDALQKILFFHIEMLRGVKLHVFLPMKVLHFNKFRILWVIFSNTRTNQQIYMNRVMILSNSNVGIMWLIETLIHEILSVQKNLSISIKETKFVYCVLEAKI